MFDAPDEDPNVFKLVPFGCEGAVFGDGSAVIIFRMGMLAAEMVPKIKLERKRGRSGGGEKEQDTLHEVYTPGKANYQNNLSGKKARAGGKATYEAPARPSVCHLRTRIGMSKGFVFDPGSDGRT